MRSPELRAGGAKRLGAAALGIALLQACSMLPDTSSAPPPTTKPAAVISAEPESTGPVDIKAAQRALFELG